MKKFIYISHPSSGKLENTLDVELIVNTLYKNEFLYNNCVFVSPIHNFGFMYNTTEYNRGLSYCLDLLYHADEMWVFGDWESSTGCKKEVNFCLENNIKLRFMGDSSNLEETLKEKFDFNEDFFTTPCTSGERLRSETYYVNISEDEVEQAKKNSVDIKELVKNRKLYSSMSTALKKVKDNNKHYVMLEIRVKELNMLDLDSDSFAYSFYNYSLNNDNINNERRTFNSYIRDYINCSSIYSIKKRITGKRKVYMCGKIRLGNYNVVIVTNTDGIESIKSYNNYMVDNDRAIIGGNLI